MNNQFTPHAIAALKYAQREALERGKSHIGPEHLLLGLLHERESFAAHVLAELGVEFETAQARVGRISGAPEGTPDNPYYTLSAKRVMQFSVEEAKRLVDLFIRMIQGDTLTQDEQDELDEAYELEPISRMPARVKCAELGWRTLASVLE